MMKKTLSMILALATTVSMMSVCSTVMADDGVTLAVVGPMTGDNAEYGKVFKTAAQIAVDEWNEKGGVLGQEITIVDYDDANQSEQAASIAEKLVGDDAVSAVMGHFSSGVAMTAAEIYQDEGLALINGSAAHMDFAKIGDCIYRNNAIYTTDANTMLPDHGISRCAEIWYSESEQRRRYCGSDGYSGYDRGIWRFLCT